MLKKLYSPRIILTVLKLFNQRKANRPACHFSLALYTHLRGFIIHIFDANSDYINETNTNNMKTQIVDSLFCVLDCIFYSFVFVHRIYKKIYQMIKIVIKVWTKRS